MSQKDQDQNLKYGSRMALLGLCEIAGLAILKGLVGWYTGVLVLLVDALTSLSDMLAIFASYIGLRMSQRASDRRFKYGYYKAETLAALVASLFILYLGANLLIESYRRLFVLEEGQFYLLAVGQVVVSVLVSFHLYFYLRKAGKKVNSLSLLNSATDKKYDALSEIVILVGIGASFFKIPYLEGGIGIALSLLILKVGLETGKESLFFLLDYFDNQVLTKKIEKTILDKSKIVKRVTNIRMRRAGTFIFGEAFLEINPFVDAKDLRNDLEYLEESVLPLDDQIKDFQLLIEIPHSHSVRVAVPVKADHGLESELALTVQETKYYIFVDVHEDKISHYFSRPFHFKSFNVIGISNFFKKEKTNIVINNGMHSLLFYNLKRLQHILVYPHFENVKNVSNTIKLLLIDT